MLHCKFYLYARLIRFWYVGYASKTPFRCWSCSCLWILSPIHLVHRFFRQSKPHRYYTSPPVSMSTNTTPASSGTARRPRSPKPLVSGDVSAPCSVNPTTTTPPTGAHLRNLCLRCAFPLKPVPSILAILDHLGNMMHFAGYAVDRLVMDGANSALVPREDSSLSVTLSIRRCTFPAITDDVAMASSKRPRSVALPSNDPFNPPSKRQAVAPVVSPVPPFCRLCASSCCSTNSLCKKNVCKHQNEEISEPTPNSPPFSSRPNHAQDGNKQGHECVQGRGNGNGHGHAHAHGHGHGHPGWRMQHESARCYYKTRHKNKI